MNKSQLYKKVQDLFPQAIGIGDVVECTQTHHKGNEYTIIDKDGDYFQTRDKYGRVLIPIKLCKLIRKLITRDMVLNKMNEINKNLSEWDKWHYSLFLFEGCIGIDATKYRKSDGKCIKLISMKWILGKPLYDQSIDMIKLVYEVLK